MELIRFPNELGRWSAAELPIRMHLRITRFAKGRGSVGAIGAQGL